MLGGGPWSRRPWSQSHPERSMVTVPGFVLRRIYVRGSLCNTPEGFEFSLCNKLASGYARQLLPISVNGQETDIRHCYFYAEEVRHRFDEVTRDTPFSLAVNKTTVIAVDGQTLTAGRQTIGMGFEVPGLGILKFDFTDVVADG